jgi:alkyl hydroperoxide reductase subunit AhpF
MQVNHKRGGLLIVPDQITHQHIQNVNVDGNAVFESEISKGQVMSVPATRAD